MRSDSTKIVWWKIALGLVLICVGFYVKYRQPVSTPFDFRDSKDLLRQVGTGVAYGLALALGGGLLYTGFKPADKD